MLVALDYDGTYTADPELWLAFIELLQSRGHSVLVATMRTFDELDDIDERLRLLVPQIVPTHRRAKREYLAAFKIVPDIWIDDQPHFLFQHGAKVLPPDPAYEELTKLFRG